MIDKNDRKELNLNTPDSESLNRAAKLINALLDQDTPAPLRIKISGWFRSEMSDEAKYTLLKEKIYDELMRNERPDEEEYRRFAQLAEKLDIKLPGTERKPTGPLRRLYASTGIIWKAAAVVILILAAATAIYFSRKPVKDEWTTPQMTYVVYESCEGVQKEINLADHSTVWVNSESKISCPSTFIHERKVHLEGEAYFSVTHDEEKPFVVQTSKLQVVVLGTEFNVVDHPNEGITEVTLYKGFVKVVSEDEAIRLEPQQKLVYTHATKTFNIERLIEERDWRSDVIHAENRTLAELFKMIGNYYGKEMIYDEQRFSNSERIQIWFGKRRTAEEVLKILSRISGDFTYEIDEEKIVIK